jgi:hypothetical protein
MVQLTDVRIDELQHIKHALIRQASRNEITTDASSTTTERMGTGFKRNDSRDI